MDQIQTGERLTFLRQSVIHVIADIDFSSNPYNKLVVKGKIINTWYLFCVLARMIFIVVHFLK